LIDSKEEGEESQPTRKSAEKRDIGIGSYAEGSTQNYGIFINFEAA